MPKPLSNDLRKRIIAFVAAGHSRRAAARHFDVSPSCVVNLMARLARDGTYAARPLGRPVGSGKLAAFRGVIIAMIEQTPDITLMEMSENLLERFDVSASLPGLFYYLRKLGYSYKKNSSGHRTWTRGCSGKTPSLA